MGVKIKFAWLHLNGDKPIWTFDWVDTKWFHAEKGFTIQGEEEPSFNGHPLNEYNLGDFVNFIGVSTFNENTVFDYTWLKQMFANFEKREGDKQ